MSFTSHLNVKSVEVKVMGKTCINITVYSENPDEDLYEVINILNIFYFKYIEIIYI